MQTGPSTPFPMCVGKGAEGIQFQFWAVAAGFPETIRKSIKDVGPKTAVLSRRAISGPVEFLSSPFVV